MYGKLNSVGYFTNELSRIFPNFVKQRLLLISCKCRFAKAFYFWKQPGTTKSVERFVTELF